jgi:hypothetical protein
MLRLDGNLFQPVNMNSMNEINGSNSSTPLWYKTTHTAYGPVAAGCVHTVFGPLFTGRATS